MATVADKLDVLFTEATFPADKAAAVTGWEEVFDLTVNPDSGILALDGKLSAKSTATGNDYIALFTNPNAADNTDGYVTIGKGLASNESAQIGCHYDTDGATSSYAFLRNYGDASTLGLVVKPGTGRIGIGTASPTGRLHIYDSSSTVPVAIIQGYTSGSGGSGKSALQLDVNGNGGFAFVNDATSGTRTFTLNSNAGWGGSSSELLRITSAGLVGINTTSPGENLHIRGSLGIQGTLWTGDRWKIYHNASDGSDDYGLLFQRGATTVLTLDKNYRVGFGVGSPSYKIDLLTDHASGYAAKFHNDGNDANRYGLIVFSGKDSPTANSDCRWLTMADGDGTAVAYIGYSTTTPYAAIYSASDERLKKNIRPTETGGLGIITGIQLKAYDWIDSKRPSQAIGYIAQQVQGVYPAMVSADADGYLSVSDSCLIPVLVKAIQELHQEIAALKGQ